MLIQERPEQHQNKSESCLNDIPVILQEVNNILASFSFKKKTL